MYDPLLARFISADTVVPGSGPLTVASLDAVESCAWASGGGDIGAVRRVELVQPNQAIYKFTVAVAHTFFVGDQQRRRA